LGIICEDHSFLELFYTFFELLALLFLELFMALLFELFTALFFELLTALLFALFAGVFLALFNGVFLTICLVLLALTADFLAELFLADLDGVATFAGV